MCVCACATTNCFVLFLCMLPVCKCVARAELECQALCLYRDLFFFSECVFMCVPEGTSLISGSVGPLPLRTPKLNSLIRPRDHQPLASNRQSCMGRDAELTFCFVVCQDNHLVVSSTQHLSGNQQGKRQVN